MAKPFSAVVGLGPPAIEDGQVKAAIQHHLLAAGAGSFERPARIVEPHVDALHEMAADIDVVVLDEDELVAELRIAHEFGDLLQHALAGLIERMRLAGEDELHGAIGIVDHRGQPLDIGQDQIRPLVGREPAGEADGQGIRAEYALQTLQNHRRLAAALGLLDGAPANELDQLGFEVEVRLPKFAVVDVFDADPDFGFAAAMVPVGAEVAIVEAEHLRREPGRNVDAVGDVADGNFVFRLCLEQASPHGARDFAVQRGDSIRATREPQCQHRHAEVFVRDCRGSRGPVP